MKPPNLTRKRPLVSLTLDQSTIDRLTEVATHSGVPKCRIVERILRRKLNLPKLEPDITPKIRCA